MSQQDIGRPMLMPAQHFQRNVEASRGARRMSLLFRDQGSRTGDQLGCGPHCLGLRRRDARSSRRPGIEPSGRARRPRNQPEVFMEIEPEADPRQLEHLEALAERNRVARLRADKMSQRKEAMLRSREENFDTYFAGANRERALSGPGVAGGQGPRPCRGLG